MVIIPFNELNKCMTLFLYHEIDIGMGELAEVFFTVIGCG